MQLSFLGAAKNVTGSRYLLEANGRKILVDCGIYQERELKDRNWQPSPVPAGEIDAVVLTHAHLDHCGLLPRLVKEGFQGSIWSTSATIDIAKIVLADCAKINEEDAEFKRKRHEREGRKAAHPEVPLYTLAEAEDVFPLFRVCNDGETVDFGGGVQAEFHEVGHILGASFVKFIVQEGDAVRRVVFSGDVGRSNMPIIRDPEVIGDADYIVCESTYGNRIHGAQEDIPGTLARIVNQTVRAGGNLVIPSFAIERTQDIIYFLAQLLRQDRIPHLRVFVDSPMAVRVSDVFKRHPQLFDEDMMALVRSFRMPGLTMVRKTSESKSINHINGTAIIIAGAGMCTGGRIKHHLVRNLPRKQSTIMFVGYQAKGTLGREIISGAEKVRILGEEYPVNASIEQVDGFSAHADQEELLDWLGTAAGGVKHIFVTHGEPEAAEALANCIKKKFGCQVTVPEYLEKHTL